MLMGSSTSFKQDLHEMAGGLGCTHDCHHAGESSLLVQCGRLKIHPVKIDNDSVCVLLRMVCWWGTQVFIGISHMVANYRSVEYYLVLCLYKNKQNY